MKPRFEVFKTVKDEYAFRLKAGNGKIILESESYHNRKDALDTISLIQKVAADAVVKDVTE